MPAASPRRAFFDTNIIVYVFEQDPRSAAAKNLIAYRGVISVQVLNEFAHVARRKQKRSYGWIAASLDKVRALCEVESLEIHQHEQALRLAASYGFSIYDSLIVASALHAGCDTLYTEDLQHGQVIEQQLRVVNPFV